MVFSFELVDFPANSHQRHYISRCCELEREDVGWGNRTNNVGAGKGKHRLFGRDQPLTLGRETCLSDH